MSSPGIELVFLESGSELRGCRERTERDVLGCSPLLQDESRPEWPVTIEVVAGRRPADAIRTITKHELGHALGLDHDDEPVEGMSNDIEDRFSEYTRRTEIVKSMENAWNGRNAGMRRYNSAIDRWNDGEYSAAVPGFEAATERYRSVVASSDIAAELDPGFDGMARPGTVDREPLRRYFEQSRRWVDLAIRAKRMAAAETAHEQEDLSVARDHVASAKAAGETLQTVTSPVPADVARVLGLLQEGAGADGMAFDSETASDYR